MFYHYHRTTFTKIAYSSSLQSCNMALLIETTQRVFFGASEILLWYMLYFSSITTPDLLTQLLLSSIFELLQLLLFSPTDFSQQQPKRRKFDKKTHNQKFMFLIKEHYDKKSANFLQ